MLTEKTISTAERQQKAKDKNYYIKNRRGQYLGAFDVMQNRLSWVTFENAIALKPDAAKILMYLLVSFQVELEIS